MKEEEKPIILKTKRGSIMIAFEDYCYHLHWEKEEIKRWRCTNRKCKGALLTNKDCDIVFENILHNHMPNKENVLSIKIKNALKNYAITTSESPRQIIDRELKAELSNELVELLPTYYGMSKIINYERKKNKFLTLSPFQDIPEEFKYIGLKELFLFYDSGYNDKNRFLILATENNFNFLKRCETWLGDGTFRVCPSDFYQLYTVHGMFLKTRIPLVYILMKNKCYLSYKKIFNIIKEKIKITPKLFVIDFEQSVLKAFKEEFENCDVKGCFYHFANIIWKKVQKSNLSEDYKNSKDIKLVIKMIINMAIIPKKHFLVELSKLKNYIFKMKNERVIKVFEFANENYFSNFSELNANNQYYSIFSFEFWNASARIISHQPTTTNSVEGWHSGLRNSVIIAHPSLINLLINLRTEQNKTNFIIKKTMLGFNKYEKKNIKNIQIIAILENHDFYKNNEFQEFLAEKTNWYFK